MTQPGAVANPDEQVHLVRFNSSPIAIDQFRVGAGGDLLDLSEVFRLRYAGEDGTNPFAEGGALKLVQRGADTVLQWAYYEDFTDVLILRNVTASGLAAANFVGGIPPDGSSVPGMVRQGTNEADVLSGTEFADTIVGIGGNDALHGNGGQDAIDGGDGNDRIVGGWGDDTLRGGGGNDWISAGQDTQIGFGYFSNSLEGGDGNDTLSSEGSLDTLDGGGGDDTLYVRGTAAVIKGGAGNDTFIIRTRDGTTTRLDGEEGRDTYVYDMPNPYAPYAGGAIEITGFQPGANGDVIDIEKSLSYLQWNDNPFGAIGLTRLVQQGGDVALQFDFDGSAGQQYGMTTVFLLKNIDVAGITAENLGGIAPDGGPVHIVRYGTDGNDDLSGGRFKTDLHGGAGDDTLYGKDEARLFGGAGNDLLNGSNAALMDGGEGDDTLASWSSGADTMLGGSGNDLLRVGDAVVTADGGDGEDVLDIGSRPMYGFQQEDATVSGGSGRDTFIVGWNDVNSRPAVITDFKAGVQGDSIDLRHVLTPVRYPDGVAGDNPFSPAAKLLQLVQSGADTLLQITYQDSWQTMLVLRNVTIADITSANFAGGISPDGAPVAGLHRQGTGAADSLEGGFYSDTLAGLAGDDVLRGLAGDDSLTGGVGNDTLEGGGGSDTLLGGDGDDRIYDDYASNGTSHSIDGGAGNDLIDIAVGKGMVRGGAGDDTFVLRMREGAAAVLDGGEGRDTFRLDATPFYRGTVRIDHFAAGAGGDVIDLGDVLKAMRDVDHTGDNPFQTGALQLVQQDGDVVLQWRGYGHYSPLIILTGVSIGDLADDNFGGLAIDGSPMPGSLVIADGTKTYFSGGMFADTIIGSDTAEAMYGDAGSDSLLGGGGDDTLSGEVGNDYLNGGSGKDRLDGGAGNDTLAGGAGDTLRGGDGDDRYVLAERGAVIGESGGYERDTVEIRFAGAFALDQGIANLVAGGSGPVQLTGNGIANSITGAEGNDLLEGGDGYDTLDGENGNDTLVGGTGGDTYVIDSRGDVIVETQGVDNAVITSLDSFVLTRYFDSLRYTGSDNFTGTGSVNGDRLEGGAGDDTLAGGDGGDRIDGGQGDDWLYGGNRSDELDGGAGNDMLSGGEGSDGLRGGDGDDTLDGGIDSDYFVGGNGNDVYFVDESSDRIYEYADGGLDEVRMALTVNGLYHLSDYVENGTVLSGQATKVYGNALSNVLKGAAGSDTLSGYGGNDILDGGAGADQLAGGEGDDVYIVDSLGDKVDEAETGGNDMVVTTLARYTLGANVESLKYSGTGAFSGTGNALGNVITGGNGNDTIDGAGGVDIFVASGALAAYTLQRGNASDIVLVTGAQKITLKNIEQVRFSDGLQTVADMLGSLGSPGSDTLAGTDGNDSLDGLAGADELRGGKGDDLYVIDNVADVIVENPNEGRDTVQVALAKGTYILAANVEDAQITSKGAAGITGNDLANVLAGNAAANTLTGGAGNDTLDGGKGSDNLVGGSGDDTYYVDVAGDKVTEKVDEGTDTIITTLAKYTLGANVENVTYTGNAAFAATGNALGNVITGGSGNDTVDGGAGIDTYVVAGAFGDYTRQRPNATDLVLVKGTQKITLKNIEYVRFSDGIQALDDLYVNVASLANDTLTGTDGADQMNGLAGADQLSGLAGDDTYFIDNLGDTVIELANGGIDTVNIAITGKGTVTLSDNVEHATITSTAALNVTGNAEANRLTGNGAANALGGGDGNDTLIGGKGSDTLTGGAGDDVYSVDATGDKVMEAEGGGYDIVDTTVTKYTLSAHVEELRFSGKGAFTGIGNALDNVIIGGASNDKLTGGAGTDTFVIGTGNDTVTDFTSGVDHLRIDRAIGKGGFDTITLGAPGGFSSDTELVIFSQQVKSLKLADAAKAIGSAAEAYSVNDTALFVLHDAKGTGVFLFTSKGDDAVVGAGELVQIATLTGVTTVAATDFLFA